MSCYIFIMLGRKLHLLILVLLPFSAFSVLIDNQSSFLISTPANQQFFQPQQNSARLLQAVSVSDRVATAGISKAISDANAIRSGKGSPSLSTSPSISTIVSQWFRALKGSLSLTTYLQLYGIVNVHIETYSSIPADYITEVLKELSLGLYDSIVNQVGTFSGANDGESYEVILIFQGGYNAQSVNFSNKNIQDVIKGINAKKAAVTPESTQTVLTPTLTQTDGNVNQSNITNNTQIQSPLPTNEKSSLNSVQPVNQSQKMKNENVLIDQKNTSDSNNQANNQANDETNNQTNNQNINQAYNETISRTITQTNGENIIKANNQTNNQINNETISQNITQDNNQTQRLATIPNETQQKSNPQQIRNQTSQQLPSTTLNVPQVVQNISDVNQTASSSIQNTQNANKSLQANQVQPETLRIFQNISSSNNNTQNSSQITSNMTNNARTQTQTISTQTTLNVTNTTRTQTQTTLNMTNSTRIQTRTISNVTNNAVRTTPISPSPMKNTNNPVFTSVSVPPTLPLITQTTFTNTTTFSGIVLSHGLPTTFIKNQIFPFKGEITTPNPSGTQVNVIFTRISDQTRLAFSQFLTANRTAFKILADLNLTGVYYLSIFSGSRGLTSLIQFTIAPSFIGRIVSRPPTPLNYASLNLIGNDLWLNWTFSDVVQPALTHIIFTQAGFSVSFLLSNYESSFKVPYSQFWAFNAGITNIQISQAFSNNESGNMRTSDFSAPFNIIFNATYHNYAIVKSTSQFATVPLQVPLGNNVTIIGPAGVQIDNEVILLTPSKTFLSFYVDGNTSNKYIPRGFPVNLSIPLKESGVYILQVNDANGEALVNIPIYYGDIYPLVPDFIDLTSSYIDLAALNQPSLIEDRRALVLDLLNSVRTSFGVGRLYMDKKLNDLAQNYSLFQIQNNYVGHIDPQGNGPSQRAAAAGILQGIGQNLAMNNNLTQAQLMLQRSPVHLRNMVDPDWTRVGLGIAQNSNRFYFLTQKFSSRDLTMFPLTSAEISRFESNLVNYLLGKYTSLQSQDKVLSSRLKSYQMMPNKPRITTYLQGFGYRNIAVANIQVNYNNGNFMQLIKRGNNFEPTSSTFRQVGVTIEYNSGNLQIFAAYA